MKISISPYSGGFNTLFCLASVFWGYETAKMVTLEGLESQLIFLRI